MEHFWTVHTYQKTTNKNENKRKRKLQKRHKSLKFYTNLKSTNELPQQNDVHKNCCLNEDIQSPGNLVLDFFAFKLHGEVWLWYGVDGTGLEVYTRSVMAQPTATTTSPITHARTQSHMTVTRTQTCTDKISLCNVQGGYIALWIQWHPVQVVPVSSRTTCT